MEITKALCLSTAHISEVTNEIIQSHLNNGRHKLPMTIWHAEYGYFMSAHHAAEDIPPKEIPADLLRLMCYAKMHECEFLRLDNDGPVEEGIETYEW